MNEIRLALRSLRNNLAFTATVVATLALGIGANAAVFDVLDRLLFRPPSDVQEADRLARIYFTQTYRDLGTYTSAVNSWAVYADLREGARSFQGLAAFHEGDVSAGRGQEAEKARASLVSHTYFPLLGVRAALGRFFAPEEDRVGADPVVVLGYGYWRRRFAGDSTALGRQVWLGRDPYTIVGVAPKGFTGVGLQHIDLWLPIERGNTLVFGHDVVSDPEIAQGSFWLQIIGRLPKSLSKAAAEQELTSLYRRSVAGRPGPSADANALVALGPLQEARGPGADQTAKVSKWLAAVAAIVLLIACANAANLMLAAAVRRRPEIAVRLALGGGRGRLLRLLFLEHLCLALLAGGVALLIAMWTGPLLRAFLLPTLPAPEGIVDLRVFGATVGATLAASVLAGLVPAWQGSRPDLVSTLKSEARGMERRSLLRSGLLFAQVAMTLTLLAGAALFVRSLRNVRALDLGLDPSRVLVATMDLQKAGRSGEQINELYLRMKDRLINLPGVERVAAAAYHPFGMASAMWVKVPGRDSLPRLSGGGPYYSVVTPGYFAAVGTEIVRGRGFTESDRAGATNVVVISENMARLVWPRSNPIGQCVTLGDAPDCYEIAGVAKDARRFAVVEQPAMHVYIPFGQWTPATITALFVRTHGDPESLLAPVRNEMQGFEPDLPLANVVRLEDLVAPSIRPWRLGAVLFTVFGVLALVVTALGLYGVLAYLVAQRTHEIGVRMALGADAKSVLRLAVGQGVRMTLLGAAFGVAGGYAAGRALSALLYDVSPADPRTYAVVVGVLLAVAALASYLPARRAARVDPMTALRYE